MSIEFIEEDIWCDNKCNNPKDERNFHDDGNNKVYYDRNGNKAICDKHHWSCAICHKVVQIG